MAYGAELSTADIPDEHQSPVSWDSILAGAAATVAMLFVLVSLGAGFGLKMSPRWPAGLEARDFTPTIGAVFIACQVAASMLGGYLAGRLRTKWLHIHDHETYFRDTAHGLLAWAASIVGLLVLGALSVQTSAAPIGEPSAAEMIRVGQIGAQISLFLGIGALTSAFAASVAATIGGMRRDDMHRLHRVVKS
ncbi:hypothetical protein [Caulobacter sp. FWC2]|uniref:hypothetical protein n=1 Tax=Caulobacter sp. FWC2 TaxID=69664 RepID=UPI000C155785|nr:hypothetical protein [Caulobacter sp. FWC2]PIB91069.1 hypothetical protein CSW62_05470 [Caulobacter sp. FWC2]